MCQCASRSKKVKCLVLVSHCGDHFQKNELLHAEVPDRRLETNISTLPYQTSGWKRTSPRCRSRPQAGNEHLHAAVPDCRQETIITTLPFQTAGWKRTSPRCSSRPQAGNDHLHAAVPDCRMETNISMLPFQSASWKRTAWQSHYTVLYSSCLQSRPDTKHILRLKKQVCLTTPTAGMSNETLYL